jgi:hypothetical protein
MPELIYQITGVEPAARGLAPLLHFRLRISAESESTAIQGLMLNAQIQIQSPQRSYTAAEKEKLVDLFGAPERWGQTLRNRLWAHSNATAGAFTGATETVLPVPCTYDLNLAAAKYFYALEAGEVPLLFLFSGSLFYASEDGRLQVERVSWNKECAYRMPIETWRELMERHYPHCSWLYLRKDVFDRLYAYRRKMGAASWEEAVDSLLPETTRRCEEAPA